MIFCGVFSKDNILLPNACSGTYDYVNNDKYEVEDSRGWSSNSNKDEDIEDNEDSEDEVDEEDTEDEDNNNNNNDNYIQFLPLFW